MGAVQGTHRKVVCAVALLGGLQPSTSGENETLLSQSNGVGGLFRGAECYTLKRHNLKPTGDKPVDDGKTLKKEKDESKSPTLNGLPEDAKFLVGQQLDSSSLNSFGQTDHENHLVSRHVQDDRRKEARTKDITELLKAVTGTGTGLVDKKIAEMELKRRASDKDNRNVEELVALLFFKKGVEEPFFLTTGEAYTAFRSLFRALWSQAAEAHVEASAQDEEKLKYLKAKAEGDDQHLIDLVNSQLDKLKMAWNELPSISKPAKKVAWDLLFCVLSNFTPPAEATDNFDRIFPEGIQFNQFLVKFKLIIMNDIERLINPDAPEWQYDIHLNLHIRYAPKWQYDVDKIKSSYEVLNGWAN